MISSISINISSISSWVAPALTAAWYFWSSISISGSNTVSTNWPSSKSINTFSSPPLRNNCSGILGSNWGWSSLKLAGKTWGLKSILPISRNTTSPVSSFKIGTLMSSKPLNWLNLVGTYSTFFTLALTNITFSISCIAFSSIKVLASSEFKLIPSGKSKSGLISFPLLKKDFPNIWAVIPPSSFANAATSVSTTKSPSLWSSVKISSLIIEFISASSIKINSSVASSGKLSLSTIVIFSSSVLPSAVSEFSSSLFVSSPGNWATVFSGSTSNFWKIFNSAWGITTASVGALFSVNSVNKYGWSKVTVPNSFDTSTAPALKFNELFGPGPTSKILLWVVNGSTEALNSVPLEPIVPEGVFTSKLAGFISLIFPERIFTLPAIIEAKSLPSFAEGSKIKSSIVNLVSEPIVITVSSINKSCDFAPSLALMVSPKYIGSPTFNSSPFWLKTLPITKPITPICSEDANDCVANIKIINVLKKNFIKSNTLT